MDKIIFVGGNDIEMKRTLFKKISENLGVKFYILKGNIKKEEPNSYFLSYNPIFFPKSAFSLLKEIKKMGVTEKTIIHSFDTLPNLLLGNIVNFLPSSIKVVRTVNGLGRLFSLNRLQYNIYKKLYLSLGRISKNAFSCSIFQNKYDLLFYKENGLLSLGTDRIIPSSGIDLAFFNPDSLIVSKEFVKKKLSLRGNWIITFIGRLLVEKGIDDFLNIVEKFQNKPEFYFVVAGSIDEKLPAHITKKLFYFHKNGFLKYFGNVTNYKIREILYVSDLLLFLSKYGEGTPRIVLESLAMKTPVISYNIHQIDEIILNGKTGFKFKNYEEIIAALPNMIYELPRINKLCRNFILNHNIDNIAKMHKDVYISIV